MASGARVMVDVKSFGLQVYAFAIAEDFGNMTGLCGNHNNDQSDDEKPSTKTQADQYRSE